MLDPKRLLEERVVYHIPGMEQAQAQKDIAYKTVDGLTLAMDVYYPVSHEGDTPLPAVILVHGDAPPEIVLNAKEWGQYVSWGEIIAASGLVAVTFNHRSTQGFTQIAEVAGDITDLIAYVRANAGSFGIDSGKLCIWSFSAGAPYGVSVALRDADGVRCIVAYYGLLDLVVLRPFVPAMVSDETLRACSPIHNLETATKIPPLLMVQAALDRPELNARIDAFASAAKERHASVEVLVHEAGHHSFDTQDDDERSRAIIRYTLDFVRKYLSPDPRPDSDL